MQHIAWKKTEKRKERERKFNILIERGENGKKAISVSFAWIGAQYKREKNESERDIWMCNKQKTVYIQRKKYVCESERALWWANQSCHETIQPPQPLSTISNNNEKKAYNISSVQAQVEENMRVVQLRKDAMKTSFFFSFYILPTGKGTLAALHVRSSFHTDKWKRDWQRNGRGKIVSIPYDSSATVMYIICTQLLIVTTIQQKKNASKDIHKEWQVNERACAHIRSLIHALADVCSIEPAKKCVQTEKWFSSRRFVISDETGLNRFLFCSVKKEQNNTSHLKYQFVEITFYDHDFFFLAAKEKKNILLIACALFHAFTHQH